MNRYTALEAEMGDEPDLSLNDPARRVGEMECTRNGTHRLGCAGLCPSPGGIIWFDCYEDGGVRFASRALWTYFLLHRGA